MTMPMAKLDLLAGYAIAFAPIAVVQAALTSAVAFGAARPATSPARTGLVIRSR